MAASKAARRLPGRPRRLPQEDLQRLRAELARPPSKLGFSQASSWSGKLLAQHLRDHYGVVLGTRQCRRILQTIETERHDRPGRIARAQQSAAPVPAAGVTNRPNFARPNSDHANKEIALRRIKRICSSGLPLYPLARALFELIGDAIPQGANRVLMADDGRHPDRYVTSSSELARWTPVHKHFFIDSPPQVSGTIPVPSILQGGVVRTHEEIVLPHFYRSEGYNECLRHIGFHHALMINLRDHLELSGNYPLWRSTDMKPFSADDIRFAQAAAPYVAHALSVATRAASPPERSSKFAPLDDLGEGVIVMGRGGRVIAVDAMARAIFQELALFERLYGDFFRSPASASRARLHRTNAAVGF
ncbi:MAG: helix-turn-helix domain-containing protein [Candidatus Binataceae bacterium]